MAVRNHNKLSHDERSDELNVQTRYFRSSLFNEIYLRHDLPSREDYTSEWHHEESKDFQDFLNALSDLAHEYCSNPKELSNWSETETINNWIKPILSALGWGDNCQGVQHPYLEETSFSYNGSTLRTDILIVDLPSEKQTIRKKKGIDKLIDARESVIVPVEAKYWDRLEIIRRGKKDSRVRSKKDDDFSKGLNPNDQILNYMEALDKDWGILTDGSSWRILHKDVSGEDSRRYYEFNLLYLVNNLLSENSEIEREEVINYTKYFYFFFRKKAFPKERGEWTLLEDALKQSKKYVNDAEQDLKFRFVQGMNTACNSLHDSLSKSAKSISPPEIREVCESTLFSLLFIKSLESRNILPMTTTKHQKVKNQHGYKMISLSRLIDQIDKYRPDKPRDVNVSKLKRVFKKSSFDSFDFDPDSDEIHNRIIRLFEIVNYGNKEKNNFGFEIEGFKETIFQKDEWHIIKNYPICNYDWVSILFEISHAKSNSNGRKFQQIPYSYFSPRQLGSIYESFLEFDLKLAEYDMVYEKKTWKKANLKSDKYKNTELPIARKNTLFFTPNNDKRKATGSYYTPDYIVKYLINKTIGKLEDQRSDFYKNYKVCDPAMGSGHFLVGALKHLTNLYVKKLYEESEGDVKISETEAKRIILDKCIFGVDINASAVKLAKLSLWLESADINYKLERLEDQLICANALYSTNIWKEHPKLMQNGFKAIIGNPPYIGEKGNKDKFMPVKAGPLKRFYQGKMDYFYFFFHLALELVQDKYRVGMISTNYFPTAMGAIKLRTDLYERSNIKEIINFGEKKIFDSAAGQHNQITIFEKREEDPKTTIRNQMELVMFHGKGLLTPDEFNDKIYSKESRNIIPSSQLFEGENKYLRINKTSSADGSFTDIHTKMASFPDKLGDLCRINNGVHTQADYLSKKKFEMRDNKTKSQGDGIYVLNMEVEEDKKLIRKIKSDKSESRLLVPFFKNSDVSQFETSSKPKKHLIYLNKRSEDLGNFPLIGDHLKSFETIISNASDNAPYLHRPKTKSDFESPKIVAPQRSRVNTFGYNEIAWYAASDVFFITSKENTSIQLKYILGLLNSKLYYVWLYYKGKRKGENLELTKSPLSEIPIKEVKKEEQEQLIEIVDFLIKNPESKDSFSALNKKIYRLFSLSKKEISAIEDFYNQKTVTGDTEDDMILKEVKKLEKMKVDRSKAKKRSKKTS